MYFSSLPHRNVCHPPVTISCHLQLPAIAKLLKNHLLEHRDILLSRVNPFPSDNPVEQVATMVIVLTVPWETCDTVCHTKLDVVQLILKNSLCLRFVDVVEIDLLVVFFSSPTTEDVVQGF